MYKCEAIAVFKLNKDSFCSVSWIKKHDSTRIIHLLHVLSLTWNSVQITALFNKKCIYQQIYLPFCGFKETARIYLSTVIAMLCWLWIIGMLDPFFICSFCLFCIRSIVFCLLQFTLVFVFLSILIAIVFSCFFYPIHFICMVGNSFII